MSIETLLTEQNISVQENLNDKRSILQRLTSLMAATQPHINQNKLCNRLWDRELTKVTSSDKGVAVPHRVCDDINEIGISLVTLAQPMEWTGNQVSIIVAIAGPGRLTVEYIHTIMNLGRLLGIDACRHDLLTAKTPQQALAAIKWHLSKMPK